MKKSVYPIAGSCYFIDSKTPVKIITYKCHQKILFWYEYSQCSHEYKWCLLLRFPLSKLYERFRQRVFFFCKKICSIGIAYYFVCKIFAIQTLLWSLVCEPSKSRSRHHCRLKLGSKLKYLKINIYFREFRQPAFFFWPVKNICGIRIVYQCFFCC